MKLFAPVFAKLTLALALTLPLMSVPAAAEDVEQSIAETIKTKINGILQRGQVQSVENSVMPNMYEVTLNNGMTWYSTADAEFILMGDLVQVTEDRVVNLTEQKYEQFISAELAKVKREDMVIFSPEGEAKSAVYVFTDVNCGWCRRFHSQIEDYNARGIEVRYLALPLQSGSQPIMESIWCADDRKAAMTLGKGGGSPDAKTCDNPVRQQAQMAQALGVRGTPAIYAETGAKLGGYVPADRLAVKLGL